MSSDQTEWAVLDDLLGLEKAPTLDTSREELAFYGRCSTEDNQDPETSYQWQLGNAEKFVDGTIVTSYFDVGQSRSVPWHRRTHANRLLEDLRNPDRGWTGIVVGEGTRCWFGNQFSLVAPRIHAYGVSIWVPELGGRFDPNNVTHSMMMNMLGGLSESERQHVQQRTRASMDAQVLNEGRHQGGRPPYGYLVVDGPPHPNPNRAADNLKLRILSIDAAAAPVVQRIFRAYLDGRGHRAIATELNRDNIVCPSAHRPEQNRHRNRDGWQASAVAAILQNPRYTGYAFFGRWTKHELLLDPDDVAAGHIVKFKRSPADRIIRSRRPAHPAIISVETFTQATLLRKQRAEMSNRTRSQRERTTTIRSGNIYLFRGRIHCDICGRKMQAEILRDAVYYRCRARTLAPGSPVQAVHPATINLREAELIEPLDHWLATLFSQQHRDETIATLLAAQDNDGADTRRVALQRRIEQAQTRIGRHLAAIEAGIDPHVVVEALNSAQADKAAAQVELNNVPAAELFTEQEVRKLIESLGDVGLVLAGGAPEHKQELYNAIELQVRYAHLEHRATLNVSPVGANVRVRRGTHSLSTTVQLNLGRRQSAAVISSASHVNQANPLRHSRFNAHTRPRIGRSNVRAHRTCPADEIGLTDHMSWTIPTGAMPTQSWRPPQSAGSTASLRVAQRGRPHGSTTRPALDHFSTNRLRTAIAHPKGSHAGRTLRYIETLPDSRSYRATDAHVRT